MKTPHDFYTQYVGKCTDVDGYYGAQCWDLAMEYSRWLGYPVFHCTTSGYVKDIWNNRKTSGILNYYDEVQKPFQDGDILVWGECPPCPVSHIAIFRRDMGDNTFIAFGQNQGSPNGAADHRIFSYLGVMGGLRPKCYVVRKEPAKLQPKPEAPKKIEQPTYTVTDKNGKAVIVTKDYNEALSKCPKDGTVVDQNGEVMATFDTRTVFRLYDGKQHLFTIDPDERNALIQAGWKDEKKAWTAPKQGTRVNRLYNSKDGDHIFSVPNVEHDELVKSGWRCEGVSFYSGGNKDVWRLYHSGAHMYTVSISERNALVKAGWRNEGAAFKAIF